MWNFLAPPAFKPEQTGSEADERYRRLRWQVFIGIFIGYAGFYIVRKNFSMAIPMLAPFGFEKGELGVVLSMNAIAYGFSKFVMASISDRSNAQRFLPLGLILAAISMMFMIVPVQWIGADNKGLAIALMAALNFLVGWFNGMGWPPCGRVMTHWFSIKERGTWMSFWNCAHNVGGALVGPMAVYGAAWFGSWFYGADEKSYFLIGTYLFPAAVAILIAIIAYSMIRDTPQSCGLSSIEKWRNDYADTYDEKSEEVLSTGQIFRTVLTNKFLWYIAFANAFVYMVRYGCLDWAPTILTEQGIDIKEAGWAYFAYEMAAVLRGEVESLDTDEHHRTINEEADTDQATNDDIDIGEVLPVDDDQDCHDDHEEDGRQGTTTVEHLIGQPTTDDRTRDGSHLVGEVGPT